MAPVTRSAGLGLSQAGNVARPAVGHTAGAEDLEMFSDPEETEADTSQWSIQGFLQPLQETAERVSQQVEEFATRLHKFNTDRASDDESLWEDAWTLLDDFRGISQKRADQTSHRSSRSSFRHSAGDAELQHAKMELEAALWQLTRRLLVCRSPQAAAQARTAQEEKLGRLHRYTSNDEIWNSFLDSDLSAQEYETVLDWLQERANKSDQAIQAVVQDLDDKSERGDGVWSAGPLHTKTIIKKNKRTRGLDRPLEAGNANLVLGTECRSRPDSGSIIIVSQLDPDAQTRQNAALAEQDGFHEEAAWLTYWELLKRGKTLKEIRAWWAERNEYWRSLVLRGCSSRSGQDIDSPWYRIINLGSNRQWLAQCRVLASSAVVTSAYQRAVYGILCGDASIPLDVCESVDEKLFTSFNALLIQRYQHYLAAYEAKMLDSSKHTFQVPPSETARVGQLVRACTRDQISEIELREPYKAIEVVLMGPEIEFFLLAVGQAASDVAYASADPTRHLMAPNQEPGDLTNSAALVAADQDSVRMIAHLQIVLKALGLLPRYTSHEYTMENNIANYIGWLQKGKKWNLVPLYASRLSEERIQKVLGTIYIDIRDDKERSLQVRLMKKYGIDVAAVLYGIFALANYENRLRFQSPGFKFTAPRLTELKGSGKAAIVKMRPEFMGGEPSTELEKTVSSVEWYGYTDAANWGKACFSVALLYKLWLCEGNFEGLKLLPQRASLAELSLKATGMNLNFVDEADEAEAHGHVNGADCEAPRAGLSPTKRPRAQAEHPLARSEKSRQKLFGQSLVWMQLEQLVLALEALDSFQGWADGFDDLPKHNAAEVKVFKHKIRETFQEVQGRMQPLLGREYLCQATDEEEAKHLEWIRNHYVTDSILGYNSALWFCGHALSRSHLVECMELAQTVATTPTLTQAFVESGRMRELVRAFALDSQSLLQANEIGKKGPVGKEKGFEIWQVSWKDGLSVEVDGLE
ncbi:hypothetical protein DV737_g3740, partial [Chaetothyriales sp. CBS 132003]